MKLLANFPNYYSDSLNKIKTLTTDRTIYNDKGFFKNHKICAYNTLAAFFKITSIFCTFLSLVLGVSFIAFNSSSICLKIILSCSSISSALIAKTSHKFGDIFYEKYQKIKTTPSLNLINKSQYTLDANDKLIFHRNRWLKEACSYTFQNFSELKKLVLNEIKI